MDIRQKILRDLLRAENDAANVRVRVGQLRNLLTTPAIELTSNLLKTAESWSRDLMTFGACIESMGDEMLGHIDTVTDMTIPPIIVPIGRDDVTDALNAAQISWKWADVDD
jgi:hypothetical protein